MYCTILDDVSDFLFCVRIVSIANMYLSSPNIQKLYRKLDVQRLHASICICGKKSTRRQMVLKSFFKVLTLVIYRLGGPYREKLRPRSWKCRILKTEVTIRTDPKPVKNLLFFISVQVPRIKDLWRELCLNRILPRVDKARTQYYKWLGENWPRMWHF